MTDNHFLPSAKSELSTGFVPEDNAFASPVSIIISGHVENLGTVGFSCLLIFVIYIYNVFSPDFNQNSKILKQVHVFNFSSIIFFFLLNKIK